MLEKLLGAAGVIAATAFFGLQFFLYAGGISYRKDCVNEQGKIATSWSFTWFAPVPYLFRPDDPSCIVHTGTRVALNAAGIATFDKATVSVIAARAVKHANPDDTNGAYWAKLTGAASDYNNRNEKVTDIGEGLRSIDTFLSQLVDLSPPAKFADGHAALVAALGQGKEDGNSLRAAAEARDLPAYKLAQRRIVPDAKKVQQAMEQLNLAHASGG